MNKNKPAITIKFQKNIGLGRSFLIALIKGLLKYIKYCFTLADSHSQNVLQDDPFMIYCGWFTRYQRMRPWNYLLLFWLDLWIILWGVSQHCLTIRKEV